MLKNNSSTKKILPAITVFLVAVILLLTITSASSGGKKKAQSQAIIINSTQIRQGLDYFFYDQDRFPKPGEFSDVNIMRDYINPYPYEEILSSNCPVTFVYKQLSAKSYELDFCLPKDFDNYKKGWNQLIGSR
jgi:hypothetical protein